jgi:hypothetical protein
MLHNVSPLEESTLKLDWGWIWGAAANAGREAGEIIKACEAAMHEACQSSQQEVADEASS